jgi:enamine deaminase RidA (YjgF/YER057c/UK114 family)
MPQTHGLPAFRKTKMQIQRHGSTRRYSDSVVHNGTVYLVEVPSNLDADITAQTENLLASVERLLAQAGSDKSRLLMATIYLADMADYRAMNAVWDAWLPEGSAPARACVQARLANPEFRVEIVLTAAS